MGLFDKLFGTKNRGKEEKQPEQAVIVSFNYGIQGLDLLHQLETNLEKVITANDLGEYDGHEIAADYSDGFIYMYGPNAEALFKGIKPTLESFDFMKGAITKLRFGPPEEGVKEIEVVI